MFSCGSGSLDKATADQVEEIVSMFLTSVPTKSVIETTHTVADGKNIKLKGVATLATGLVGDKVATVYENVYEELAEVSNNLAPITTKTETLWYLEGKGICRNKSGEWDATGTDFAPGAGSIKLNLDPSIISEASYDAATETMTLKFSKDNATKVVEDYLDGQTIESELTVTVVTHGGSVTEVTISYTIPEHQQSVEGSDETVTIQETYVFIKATYSYDIQNITLE